MSRVWEQFIQQFVETRCAADKKHLGKDFSEQEKEQIMDNLLNNVDLSERVLDIIVDEYYDLEVVKNKEGN